MATVSSNPAAGMQQIDLSKLAVPQLAQLKQQLDQVILNYYGNTYYLSYTTKYFWKIYEFNTFLYFQEINVIQDSLQTLKMAQSKFQESGQALENIKPDVKGETILVPLTGSMYVPGTIADIDHVLIDIGTGYYAQKVSFVNFYLSLVSI